jgi:hypothetical protein
MSPSILQSEQSLRPHQHRTHPDKRVTNPSDVTRPDEVEAPTYLEFSQSRSPRPLDINGFEGHPIPLANGITSERARA